MSSVTDSVGMSEDGCAGNRETSGGPRNLSSKSSNARIKLKPEHFQARSTGKKNVPHALNRILGGHFIIHITISRKYPVSNRRQIFAICAHEFQRAVKVIIGPE